MAGGILLLALCTVAALRVGSYPLSFSDIFAILAGDAGDAMDVRVFFQLRLPRVVMGLLAGFVFGLTGAVFQLLFHNPLASPDLIGVSSGASLGAACMIVLGAGSSLEIMFGSFVGGMMILVAVILLVKASGGRRSETYILAGIASGALSGALIMLLKYMADSEGELAAIEFWTMGSLSTITQQKVLAVLVPALVSVLVLLLLKKEILLLGMGEKTAAFMGMNHEHMRMLILTLCTLATAAVISLTGVISFVGLIAPHLSYLLLRTRTHGYLAFSGMCGSALVVLADCFARSIRGGELPTSILTMLCAIPFFIYFLCKRKGAVE